METFWSQYQGHAELLAASARLSGYDRVIAVGGDGTLFEVLNGLWPEKKGELPSVGMVPFGTGCDYVRNFDGGTSRIERLRAAMSPRVYHPGKPRPFPHSGLGRPAGKGIFNGSGVWVRSRSHSQVPDQTVLACRLASVRHEHLKRFSRLEILRYEWKPERVLFSYKCDLPGGGARMLVWQTD